MRFPPKSRFSHESGIISIATLYLNVRSGRGTKAATINVPSLTEIYFRVYFLRCETDTVSTYCSETRLYNDDEPVKLGRNSITLPKLFIPAYKQSGSAVCAFHRARFSIVYFGKNFYVFFLFILLSGFLFRATEMLDSLFLVI